MSQRDRQDYADLLDELGIDDEFVQQDMAHFPVIELNDPNVSLGLSSIAGTGLFVKRLHRNGTIAATLRGQKTIAGRYTNHSPNPNARMEQRGEDMVLVALRDLVDEEVTIDYRDTPAVRTLRAVNATRLFSARNDPCTVK